MSHACIGRIAKKDPSLRLRNRQLQMAASERPPILLGKEQFRNATLVLLLPQRPLRPRLRLLQAPTSLPPKDLHLPRGQEAAFLRAALPGRSELIIIYDDMT